MAETIPANPSARPIAGDDEPSALDARPGDDYEICHASGNGNADRYDELQGDAETTREAPSTIPEGGVILACTAGVASEKTAEYRREVTYDTKMLCDQS